MLTRRFTAAALLALAGAVLVGAVLAVPVRTGNEVQKEKPAGGPKAVTVAHPTWFYPKPFEDYTGRLEAHEAVEVGAGVGGRLAKIHFKPGAEVRKGDLLFEIEPGPYQTTVDRAEMDLNRAETERNRTEADLEKVKADRAGGRPIQKKAIGDFAVKLET
jgi:multidrug efflux pump subunit AcrA (membrane-fusion protein)